MRYCLARNYVVLDNEREVILSRLEDAYQIFEVICQKDTLRPSVSMVDLFQEILP